MSPAALVDTLRARGVTLEAHGDRLKVRPASCVTPDEVEMLRQHKPAVLGLLSAMPAVEPIAPTGTRPIPDLDARTLAEHFCLDVPPFATVETINNSIADAMLSGRIDPRAVADLHEEVVALVRQLELGIRTGKLPPRQLVAGRQICDWIPLETLAQLLRAGGGR